MKTVNRNFLKAAFFGLMMTVGASLNAQTTDAGTANTTQANAAGEVIKLIDNKGTIKYLQSNNGITTITSTAANNRTTTTWQLGGELVEATTITTSVDGTFTIDGEEFNLTNTQAQADGAAAATVFRDANNPTATGYTLLTRDEATGQVQKMLATDLVSGIRVEWPQPSDASADVEITVTGLPSLTATTTMAKLFVFRNGAKLRAGTDFTAAEDKVTITYDADDLPMYSGDFIEIQYIK